MILTQKKINQYEDFQKLQLWEKSEQKILNIWIFQVNSRRANIRSENIRGTFP